MHVHCQEKLPNKHVKAGCLALPTPKLLPYRSTCDVHGTSTRVTISPTDRNMKTTEGKQLLDRLDGLETQGQQLQVRSDNSDRESRH